MDNSTPSSVSVTSVKLRPPLLAPTTQAAKHSQPSQATLPSPAFNVRQAPPPFMNEREVAAFLGLAERSIRNFVNRGLIPVIRIGRRKIYRRDAVVAAMQKLEQ